MDGWTLNKKIDTKHDDLKEYIMYIGGKLLELEERMDRLDGKTKRKKERKNSKRDA